MSTGEPKTSLGRRALVFQRLLEEVRLARAESRVLVASATAAAPPWTSLTTTRSCCDRLHVGLTENEPMMGRVLVGKVEALLSSLEEAISEVTLCSLLGPEDESARGALDRARRTVELDSARLESAIRAEMATLMMVGRAASA